MRVESGSDVDEFWNLSIMPAVCTGSAALQDVPLSPEKGSIVTGMAVVVMW